MGATVPVHHLQNQIKSFDFTVWNQQGVLDGAKNVLSDIKTKETRQWNHIATYLDTSQLFIQP